MPDKSLDQERVAFAWQRLQAAAVTRDYVNLAKGAPALIMSNGLMQTLAFYKSKTGDHHRRLLTDVLEWLGNQLGGQPVAQGTSFPSRQQARFDTVMASLHAGSSDLYIRATEEALEILRWIRQLASALQAGG